MDSDWPIATTLANIDVAYRYVSPAQPHILVLSLLTGGDEGIGTDRYTRVTTTNASLAATYGDHYLDVRAILAAGTPDDTVPAIYRADIIHLNNTGYLIVANAIVAYMQARGW
jgi:lysophospholipase L1-like esterase